MIPIQLSHEIDQSLNETGKDAILVGETYDNNEVEETVSNDSPIYNQRFVEIHPHSESRNTEELQYANQKVFNKKTLGIETDEGKTILQLSSSNQFQLDNLDKSNSMIPQHGSLIPSPTETYNDDELKKSCLPLPIEISEGND
ncbi:unnamed protein product [Heterobilharzia americana]|nr:unnamed protein product [Heterobilharzia americana]